MAYTPKILAFAGSARKDSFNKKLVKISVEGARKSGAEVTLIDLRDYPIPLFDQDLEALSGMPANAQKIKDLMMTHDGFLISSPEYNSTMTPLLKNTLDWVSRGPATESPSVAYKAKFASIMSASPGGLGGLRSLASVRALLEHLGVIVLPSQVAVSKAHEAFNPDGSLKDPKQQLAIEQLGINISEFIKKIKN